VTNVAEKPISAQPEQSYTLFGGIGSDIQQLAQVEFAVTPPVFDQQLAATQEPGEPYMHVTLAWACHNADHCILYGQNGAKLADDLPLKGTQMIPTGQPTTYRLECVGAGSRSSELLVNVPHSPWVVPVGVIDLGSKRRVFWEFHDAVRCEVLSLDSGQVISTDMSGDTFDSGHRFRFTGWGNGTSSTDM
jgi:hypothetical protein